ncbi:plant invertase/pectin methylesterase inhibitor [Striga asiatica]|uniref:Plant invertase/pectin methylesterase inhibitor n=1 Tax=Striga asiatica TaxID=4170 RepID=A0A5A7PRI5_STRAF|nr:plant invertase/pectin methylesterase inhibitor [Striga asiatica]
MNLTYNKAPKTVTNNKAPKTVTDALIDKVCQKTEYPPICRQILVKFKYSPVVPTTLSSIIVLAKNHAQITKGKISSLHKGIKENVSELRLRYHKCIKNYEHALTQLNAASEGSFRIKLNIASIKKHILTAISDVQSCTTELAKQRNEISGLTSENRRFQNIGSVILGICDEIS